jgi:hypothetical protein
MHPGSRRFSLFVSTLALASLALGRLPAADDEPLDPRPAELRLVFVDLCDMAPGLRHGTLREIRALLEPTGMKVTGSTVAPAEDQASGGAYVIFMPFDPSRPRTQPVGGVARRENGRQLSVWVFPPFVAGGLGLDLGHTSWWTHRHRQQFQRAMAVVVVHELAHALAGASHRPEGLMSPQLRRARLLDPKLVVDTDLHDSFLAGVARLNAPAEPRPSSTPQDSGVLSASLLDARSNRGVPSRQP